MVLDKGPKGIPVMILTSRIRPKKEENITDLEIETLLRCVRRNWTVEDDKYITDELDWDRFFHLADRHRLAAILLTGIGKTTPYLIPQALQERFQKQTYTYTWQLHRQVNDIHVI